MEENFQLKERVDQAEVSKDALMRLVWQHLETINRIQEENTTLAMQMNELHKSRKEAQMENLKVVAYMEDLEKRMYEANMRSLETMKAMRDQEHENSTLKTYIIDLKAKVSIYLPMKTDQIDMRVADYINNFPDRNKLKIMFLRESTGVYQFGSKRVNIRIENGKILIRVGGGYLNIDEFID